MNGLRWLGGVALVGAALAGPPARAQDDVAATAGCTAAVAAQWAPPGGNIYRVTGVASGRSCAVANVTLTIRGRKGVLLTFTSAAADLPLLFAEATTPAAMTAALRQWIAQPAPGRTTRDLPPWEAGEEEPAAGEFLFHPEPAITRSVYATLRKAAQPAFCFVQGGESEGCYALDPKTETLTLIGMQTLPG